MHGLHYPNPSLRMTTTARAAPVKLLQRAMTCVVLVSPMTPRSQVKEKKYHVMQNSCLT